MARSDAATVAAYLKELPAERRAVIAKVRDVIRRNLPAGYEEVMNYGMIAYQVPLARYPKTYNGQPLMYAALAAQKNNFAVYLTGVYADPAKAKRLRDAFAKAGKKVDMGKSCVRFGKLEDLALDAIGEVIASVPVAEHISRHEESRK